MEYLTCLTDVIIRKRLSEEEAVKLGIDICSALELCEKKKIIHRDIKPSNIIITHYDKTASIIPPLHIKNNGGHTVRRCCVFLSFGSLDLRPASALRIKQVLSIVCYCSAFFL